MSKPNGGPAFPTEKIIPCSTGTDCPIHGEGGLKKEQVQGMTLRDYFAAKAMQGLMKLHIPGGIIVSPERLAEEAYSMADAMLAQRDK